jgi:hypothetical protein
MGQYLLTPAPLLAMPREFNIVYFFVSLGDAAALSPPKSPKSPNTRIKRATHSSSKHVRPTRHLRSTLRSTPQVRSVHYQVARPHTLAHVEVVFKLRTTTFPAVVSFDDEVEDPAGHGRRRVVNIKLVGRGAKTCAWWTLRGFLRMRK